MRVCSMFRACYLSVGLFACEVEDVDDTADLAASADRFLLHNGYGHPRYDAASFKAYMAGHAQNANNTPEVAKDNLGYSWRQTPDWRWPRYPLGSRQLHE